MGSTCVGMVRARHPQHLLLEPKSHQEKPDLLHQGRAWARIRMQNLKVRSWCRWPWEVGSESGMMWGVLDICHQLLWKSQVLCSWVLATVWGGSAFSLLGWPGATWDRVERLSHSFQNIMVPVSHTASYPSLGTSSSASAPAWESGRVCTCVHRSCEES